ncbi:hypothetical protein M433DRAFT_138722 [Acidomyces richmondensis BFW]|nr:hypothetical protein M433DRAFT_138722 [Acidomyces richmondensis BFW]
MAAYDIQKHFKGLRVDTGRRKGRDPFATGFEDDSEEEAQNRRSRARERAEKAKLGNIPVGQAPSPKPLSGGPIQSASILDQLKDSDDDFLDPPKRFDRRPSPAPAQLASLRVSEGAGRRGSVDHGLQAGRPPRSAVAQAAGSLALLDDSDDDDQDYDALRRRRRRRQTERTASPAPKRPYEHALKEQSQARLQPSRHTVASPFAGTKYLEDSESDTDEEAVASRKGSATSDDSSTVDPLSPYESALAPKHPEVKRVDKPKASNGGSSVSWRAFSASRAEQRSTEIEALQASLRSRGKSISFGTHAITDDGERIPVPPRARHLRQTGSGAGGGTGKEPKQKPSQAGRGRATVR